MDRHTRSSNGLVAHLCEASDGEAPGTQPIAPVLVRLALFSGLVSSLVYIGTDLLASFLYEGYSFRDQAVSELFAIGAPTAGLVVPLFTLSSMLLVVFGWGLWESANNSRLMRAIAVMVFANAADSLVLWNAFPMHMRGVEPSLTDTMHAILAVNPFVLAAIVVAAVWSVGWFRVYSVAVVILVSVLAVAAFHIVPALRAHEPTYWMGLAERAAQYVHQTWLAVFALALARAQIARCERQFAAIMRWRGRGRQLSRRRPKIHDGRRRAPLFKRGQELAQVLDLSWFLGKRRPWVSLAPRSGEGFQLGLKILLLLAREPGNLR